MSTAIVKRFIALLSGWVLLSGIGLVSLDVWSRELYFILVTVGYVLILEYTATPQNTPTWHRRLQWLTWLLVLGFGYIVGDWVTDTAGIGMG